MDAARPLMERLVAIAHPKHFVYRWAKNSVGGVKTKGWLEYRTRTNILLCLKIYPPCKLASDIESSLIALIATASYKHCDLGNRRNGRQLRVR